MSKHADTLRTEPRILAQDDVQEGLSATTRPAMAKTTRKYIKRNQQSLKKKPKKPTPSSQSNTRVSLLSTQFVPASPPLMNVEFPPLPTPSVVSSSLPRGSIWGTHKPVITDAIIKTVGSKYGVATVKTSSEGSMPEKAAPVSQIKILNRNSLAPTNEPFQNLQLSTPAKQNLAKVALPINNPENERKFAMSISKERKIELPSVLDAFTPKQRDVDDAAATAILTIQKKLGIVNGEISNIKKGRQRLQPRKKKFSSLKKKILQERLTQWRTLNSPGTHLRDGHCTVAIRCFCSAKDLEDDDEYEEVVANLQEMAAKIGEYKTVYIPREAGEKVLAYVWFTSCDDAAAAQAVWDGLVLGGEKLQAHVILVDESSVEDWQRALLAHTDGKVTGTEATLCRIVLENILTQEDLDDPDCLEESLVDIRAVVEKYGHVGDIETIGEAVVVTYQESRDIAEKAVHYLQGTLLGGSVISAKLEAQKDLAKPIILVIRNVLTTEDFEDEDCLEESLGDIRSLVSKHAAVISITADKADSCGAYIELDVGPMEGISIARQLDGIMIGGQRASVSLKGGNHDDTKPVSGFVLLQNILTEDDLDDDDCLNESKLDIANLSGRFGTLLRLNVNLQERTVTLEYSGGPTVAETAAREFNGMVIGGQIVTASALPSGDAAVPSGSLTMIPSNSVMRTEMPNEPKELYSGDKLIPERFAEMKRAPKVANAGIPRKYASLVDDDEVKPLLIDMLGELMRLQRRAVDENNAKAKRRLVMGLREVARGIRSHKVKIVVMANNLDEYGALDDKLQEILDLSSQESIPIFFEFNKRKLGQAIGKNIKIAVIGVQNAEGAHQQFKKIMTIARKHKLI